MTLTSDLKDKRFLSLMVDTKRAPKGKSGILGSHVNKLGYPHLTPFEIGILAISCKIDTSDFILILNRISGFQHA